MTVFEKEVRIKAFNLGTDLDSAAKVVIRETSEKMEKGEIKSPFDYMFKDEERRR